MNQDQAQADCKGLVNQDQDQTDCEGLVNQDQAQADCKGLVNQDQAQADCKGLVNQDQNLADCKELVQDRSEGVRIDKVAITFRVMNATRRLRGSVYYSYIGQQSTYIGSCWVGLQPQFKPSRIVGCLQYQPFVIFESVSPLAKVFCDGVWPTELHIQFPSFPSYIVHVLC